jgi:phosphatidate cytidylyltransferase
MKAFIIRTITSVLFVAAVVSSFLKPEAMVLLFALVTGLILWEFGGLINDSGRATINRFITTAAGVYLFLAMAGFASSLTPSSVFIPYLLTVIYLLIAELYLKQADPLADWAYTMMSQMYIALPLSLISVLAFHSGQEGITFNYALPLSIFVFLWLNDAGAYCIGSLLGRHKLFPRISPGKSWEGSIGGGLLVMAGTVGVWHLAENLGLQPVGLSLPAWIGLGLVVVFFGTWGDLVESLFKRTLGIKDSGNILPGHGGMLDRFDSTLMAMPAAVVYLYTLTLL